MPSNSASRSTSSDPVLLAIPHIGSAKRQTFHSRCQTIGFNGPGALLAGDPGQHRRPVPALRGQRKIVAPRNPSQQRQGLARARPRWNGDDTGHIGIAGKNSVSPIKHQYVNRSVGKGALDAAYQRSGQQNVAKPAQGNDQHARLGRQFDPVRGCHGHQRHRLQHPAPTCQSGYRVPLAGMTAHLPFQTVLDTSNVH